MESISTWIQEVLGNGNTEGIIAISALLAWLLPKLIYFFFKFLFNTLLFLANVFGRDSLEQWLKNKINGFLSGIVPGAKVDDIPRWLNKDQLALRELHWEQNQLVLDVPSVIVTVNLPMVGYNAFKLKLRYLFNKERFMQELNILLHNQVREIRIQEPAISYNANALLRDDGSPTKELSIAEKRALVEQKEKAKDNLVQLLKETIGYHFHVILEHGSLQLVAGEEHFIIQDFNLDLYNRASHINVEQPNYKFSLMLTGLYDGANISMCNVPDSLKDYLLVINRITITPAIWRLAVKANNGLVKLQVPEEDNIGKIKDLRLELSLEERLRITLFEGLLENLELAYEDYRVADFGCSFRLSNSQKLSLKNVRFMLNNHPVSCDGTAILEKPLYQHGALRVNSCSYVLNLINSRHLFQKKETSYLLDKLDAMGVLNMNLEGTLAWNREGVESVACNLVLENGKQLRLPCSCKNGKLCLEVKQLELIKETYKLGLEKAEMTIRAGAEKVNDTLKNRTEKVNDTLKANVEQAGDTLKTGAEKLGEKFKVGLEKIKNLF